MSSFSFLNQFQELTDEPTGFAQPDDVVVTANGDRTITLSGTVNGYYKGVKLAVLTSGYISGAHGSDTAKLYFLTYNGINLDWRDLSVTPLDFKDLLIAYTFYDTGNTAWVYFKESHGFLPWQTHKAEHLTIGTYKKSGGTLSGYTPASTTAAERRPNVAETVIQDEDVATTLAAMTSELYTRAANTGTGTFTFTLDAAEIVPVSGSNPYYNSFSSPNWGQTLMPANSAATVWLFALPVSADAGSQKYRFIWVQPQWITQAGSASAGALTTARAQEEARNVSELNLTTLTTIAPEFICFARLTIQYASSNWTVQNVIALTGTRYSLVGTPAGNFLQSVSVDSTQFSGNGTTGSALSLTGRVGLSVDTTFYVATTGSDTTGDGSSGSPYATLAKALSVINDYMILPDVQITIELGDGAFTISATITDTPKGGKPIIITGNRILTKSMSSVQSSSGVAGNYSIIINLNNVTDIAVNDSVIVTASTGGTNPVRMNGCWLVTNVDSGNNRITVTSTNYTGVPAGAVLANVDVLKTTLSGTNLILFENCYCTLKQLCLTSTVTDIIRIGNAAATSPLHNVSMALMKVGIRGAGSAGIRNYAGVIYAYHLGVSACGIGIYVSIGGIVWIMGPNGLGVNASSIAGNGTYGIQCIEKATVDCATVTDFSGNSTNDMYAGKYGYINAESTTYASTSPTVNTAGNEGGYIDV